MRAHQIFVETSDDDDEMDLDQMEWAKMVSDAGSIEQAWRGKGRAFWQARGVTNMQWLLPPERRRSTGPHSIEYNFEYEIEVPDPDSPGDTTVEYLDMTADISAWYDKGYRGSYNEPPEPAHYYDFTIDDLYINDPKQKAQYPLSPEKLQEIEDYLMDNHLDSIKDKFNYS